MWPTLTAPTRVIRSRYVASLAQETKIVLAAGSAETTGARSDEPSGVPLHPLESGRIAAVGFKRGQLRDFVAVAEAGQVTTAARGLGLPQPLLSQSIRQLEHELGVELLEREPRGVKLDVLSLDVGLARRQVG